MPKHLKFHLRVFKVLPIQFAIGLSLAREIFADNNAWWYKSLKF